MYYIIGLGNPTERYFNTRHNIGRLAVESFGNKLSHDSWDKDKITLSKTKVVHLNNQPVILLLPEVFMNQSGQVTAVLKNKYEVDFNNIIVIHDDVDLPFANIKISVGRGHGGNNGVKSIIKSLNSNEFTRIRIGISYQDESDCVRRPPGGESLERFVLQPFSKSQQKEIPKILNRVDNVITDIIENDVSFAMNKYN